MSSLSPMMQQYQSVRGKLPGNTLLLFRLGDFYEMFFEDAKEAAGILNVALTKRNGVPMCGVPFHAAEGYIGKLVKAGKRVALCDQVGEARPGKIVERELTQIISPGTVSDVNLLESARSHYLAAICVIKGVFGFAYVDLSTGDFRLTEIATEAALRDEIARVSPSELIVSDEQTELTSKFPSASPHDGYAFLPDHASYLLKEHFGVQSLDGFGCAHMNAAVAAAGGVLHYLKHQLRRKTDHILRVRVYRTDAFVELDAATQSHLELVSSRGARDTSLLAALDRSCTPMGARKLRDWILHPLRDRDALVRRQEVIAGLLEEPSVLASLREALKNVRDIERTVSRLSQGSGNARDLQALGASLEQVPAIRDALGTLLTRRGLGIPDPMEARLESSLVDELQDFPELIDLIKRAIVDEPPAVLKEGGMIREGFDPALDELRRGGIEGRDWIAQLQAKEIERTGIKSLKIRYTSVFGYFIEITKSNLDAVPADYIRKQTTVNGERFITPELKEMEGKILGADERSRALEYEIFLSLRSAVVKELSGLQQTADAIARLDVLCGLAETARLYGYCRPELHEDRRFEIIEGRHPVLDQNLAGEKFVPNDTRLDGEKERLLIITGPNMAGKSTYIRQVALIALMAQIGSFVPARSAQIGLVDRIFTRVGASDDLSRGQSTFMVEMNETANILNNATDQSLVILDEIGRGTSTFDGLSIAWSVAEYLHDQTRARTLFATHYHELTDLAATRPAVKNYNVAVREWNDQIIFLHKIVPGTADKSYGIQVARLAGLPQEIIERAKEILGNLERSELNAEGRPVLAEHAESRPGPVRRKKPRETEEAERPQMHLF
jgi:DNA mismatch repair protein MutS